ncbi:hypothetical protein GCM10009820_05360 [Leifsonia soli]
MYERYTARMTMRLPTIVREALLNVRSGTARAGLFALVLGAVAAVLGGSDLVAIASIEHEADRFRKDGGSTIIYRFPQGIDGAACDGLRSVDGVAAAGAVRQRERGYTPAALPREPIPTFDVSPAFGGFTALRDEASGAGVLISEDVAETTGASVGTVLHLTDGRPRVTGVFSYPNDGRRPGYGYAIFVPSDVLAPYDECWVEAWPVSDRLLAVMPTALVGAGSAPTASSDDTRGPQLQQLNASHGSTFDGAVAFETRVTRMSTAVLGLVGFVLGAVSVGRRKLELASGRHAGVSATASSLQLVLETLVWAAMGALVALSLLSLVIATGGSSSPDVLCGVAARVLIVTLMAPALGAFARAATIREAHLFAYFKAR